MMLFEGLLVNANEALNNYSQSESDESGSAGFLAFPLDFGEDILAILVESDSEDESEDDDDADAEVVGTFAFAFTFLVPVGELADSLESLDSDSLESESLESESLESEDAGTTFNITSIAGFIGGTYNRPSYRKTNQRRVCSKEY